MSEQEQKIYKEVGDEIYAQYYFEQYKIYVSGIEKISDRRENANKYFVTLNSGIIVAIGFQLQHVADFFFKPAIVALLSLGIVLSIVFFFLIGSYKQMNRGKFKILHKMEENLPIKMYKDEHVAKNNFSLSDIERIVPVVFLMFYIISLFYFISVFLCL